MTKMGIVFTGVIVCLIITSCENTTSSEEKPPTSSDSSTSTKTTLTEYKAIKYVDSFINSNSAEIKKNTALKEHYEGLCTRQMLALIDKKGLYNDIPFKLVATTINKGIAYGNFVYDEDKYFIKVQSIIKKKQLDSLVENETYFIKFKIYKFEEGVSFENSFSKIELPTVNAYLTEFEKNSK